MPTQDNKVKFGLKNVYYAVATLNDDGSATYGTPVRWPGAVNLSLDAQGETNKFRADNIDYYVSQSNSGYQGDFESALIPDSFRKDVLGEIEDSKGVLVEDAGSLTKSFALMFQFEGDIKATRHVLYNCTCTRPQVSSQTTGTTIEPQTETATLTAVSVYNSALGKDIVKAKTNADTDETTYGAWFESVYQPTADNPSPDTPVDDGEGEG